ncbi:MAG TPA: hypothetical protein VJY62_01380 [Bacteroidia bacterium]|nr:hypothetical protein [Bacteroidia bacterium]
MKRIAVILFTLLYLVSASGIAISNFYCCGKLKETYLLNPKYISNDCKGNKLPGCCDTKTVLIKVKDNHSPSQQLKSFTNDFSIQLFGGVHLINDIFLSADESPLFAFIHAPPLISKSPVYLSVCNFRI